MRKFKNFLKFQRNLSSSDPVILIDISGNYKYGSKRIQFADAHYADADVSLGSIDQKMNLFTRGMGTISDADFDLESPDASGEFWDQFLSPTDCKVYLSYDTPDIESVNVADARGLLYHGNIIKTKRDEERIRFSVINSFHKYYTNLPQHTITYELYPLAEEGVLGSTIPILYGNFNFNYGGDERPYQNLIKDGVTSPCLLVDSSVNQYIFASHPVKEFDIPASSLLLSDIVQLESSNRQLISFYDPDATTNIAAGFSWFKVELDDDHRAWFRMIPVRRGLLCDVDPQNILDGPNPTAVTTYVTLGLNDVLSVKWKSVPPPEMFSGPNWPKLYVVFQSSGANTIQFRLKTYLKNEADANFVWHDGSNGNAYAGACIAKTVAENETDFVDVNYWYRTFPAAGSKRDVKGSDFKDINFAIENCAVQEFTVKAIYFECQDLRIVEGEWTPPPTYFETPHYLPVMFGGGVGDLGMHTIGGAPGVGTDQIKYDTVQLMANRFSADYHAICKGRMYNENDVWMSGSLGRWTNSDAYRTGQLIENPVHVIESLYRDELGLGDFIDTGSFDLAAKRRADYDACGYIHGIQNSWDLFNSIGIEFRTSIMHLPSITANAGKIYAYVSDWDDATHISEAGVSGIFHEDFMSDFKVEQTALTEVYDDYVIDYGMSSSFGNYRFQVYANPSADNHDSEDLTGLCTRARDSYLGNVSNPFRTQLRFVRNHSTAQRILSDIVNLRTKTWWMCSFKTQLQGSHLDMCDIISIYHSDLPASLQDKKWEISRAEVDEEEFEVRIEAICINEG